MGSRWRGAARWPLWGLGAGAFGVVATLATDDQGALSDAELRSGAAVVEALDRWRYHVGVVAGMLAVLCLVMLAAAWRRWSDRDAGRLGLAGAAVPGMLGTSAAALLVAYGFKGALAEYLPGGINDDNFPDSGLYVLFMLNDTAPWFGWFGVVLAAGLVAWSALVRRVLPVWLGLVSALALLGPVAIMVASGAVAVAGVVGPVWLVVAFAALTIRPPDRG